MKNCMLRVGISCRRAIHASWLLVATVLIVSCKREANNVQVEKPVPEIAGTVQAETAASCCWVAITNQATRKIEVYDPADASWNSSTIKWSWMPTTALSYNASSELPLWETPTDIKVRNNTVFASTAQVITATSYRLATIARYTGTGTRGQKLWVMGFNDTTSVVNFYNATTGAAAGSRTVSGAAIYKGKTFDPNYY